MENSHLKTAQDQVAKGGYSIILKPEDSSSAAWFTTRTVERYITIYIRVQKVCYNDADSYCYGSTRRKLLPTSLRHLGLAKKIKNGTSKTVLEKVEEARAAALSALKEHMNVQTLTR
ncbi:unnamed protein product [Brassica rapa subsp. narinosa]